MVYRFQMLVLWGVLALLVASAAGKGLVWLDGQAGPLWHAVVLLGSVVVLLALIARGEGYDPETGGDVDA